MRALLTGLFYSCWQKSARVCMREKATTTTDVCGLNFSAAHLNAKRRKNEIEVFIEVLAKVGMFTKLGVNEKLIIRLLRQK